VELIVLHARRKQSTVPQSLHRTWVALAVATLAVLVVALLTGRDFVRDVNALCPGALHEEPFTSATGTPKLDPVYLESVASQGTPSPITSGPAFVLTYDQKQKQSNGYAYPTEFKNVRVQWKEPGAAIDARCATCGSVSIALSGEAPADLHLFRERGTNRYVVKGRPGYDYSDDAAARAAFTVDAVATHRIQLDRIFTARQLPFGVALVALGALVVALFRSRRAMSYARTIHAWTEARLTPGGMLESDAGGTLGTVEQTRFGGYLPAGPVLVAPEALATNGLYRDVPIVQRRQIAEGTHQRWASGTMLRLRDARALAVISTACTLLAAGARFAA